MSHAWVDANLGSEIFILAGDIRSRNCQLAQYRWTYGTWNYSMIEKNIFKYLYFLNKIHTFHSPFSSFCTLSILILQLFESPIKCTIFSTEHSGESGPTIHDSPLGMDHLHSVKLKVSWTYKKVSQKLRMTRCLFKKVVNKNFIMCNGGWTTIENNQFEEKLSFTFVCNLRFLEDNSKSASIQLLFPVEESTKVD